MAFTGCRLYEPIMSMIEKIFAFFRPRQHNEFEYDPYTTFVLSVLRKFVIMVIALAFAIASIYTATNFFEVVYVVSEFIDRMGRNLGL